MEPLKNILRQRTSISQNLVSAKRVQTYIKKKHGCNVQISFRGGDLIIHVKSSSQAALLNLDKMSLEQISGYFYAIKITLKAPK